MGKAKLNGGGNLNVKNGVIKRGYGSKLIPANTFVEVKNNGTGELCVGQLNSMLEGSAMLTENKVLAMTMSGEYFGLVVGTLNGDKVAWGTELSGLYGPDIAYFVLSPTKVVVVYLADSGYFLGYLLTISGTTVTKSAQTSDFGQTTGPGYYGAFKISDTQVLTWECGYNGGYVVYFHLLTVSGNTLTVTNSTLYKNYGESYTYAMRGNMIAGNQLITIERSRFGSGLSDGSSEEGVYLRLHSVSGTTITEITSVKVNGVSDFSPITEFKRFDDNSIVGLIYKFETGGYGRAFLCKVTKSGNTLVYNEYPTNLVNLTGSFQPYILPSAGFELVVDEDGIYVMRVNHGDAHFMKFDRNFNLVEENTKSFGITELSTHQLGNALIKSDGEPIVSVFAYGYSSAAQAGAIVDYNRFEVKPAESKIDGLTNTSVSPSKDGRIWFLGGDN